MLLGGLYHQSPLAGAALGGVFHEYFDLADDAQSVISWAGADDDVS